MSETAKALGLPASFEWRGKALKLSPVTLEIESYYASVLEERAAAGLTRTRRTLGEDAYADAVRLFIDYLAAGEFEWTGRVAVAARAAGPGTRELVWLCLCELQPGFTRQQLFDLYRDREKWPEVVGLLRGLLEVPPNGRAPAGLEPAAGSRGEPQTSSAPSGESPGA